MSIEDAHNTRVIQHELVRRYVETSMMTVRVTHGVAYLGGIMQRLRSHPEVDLDHEAEVIRKIIRNHREIRDVIWEVHIKK